MGDVRPHGIHHVALRVDDLRDAEAHYGELLGLDVLFRERLRDGAWWTVEGSRDPWAADDTTPHMSALSGPGFYLTLFGPDADLPWWSDGRGVGRLSHVGVTLEDVDGVGDRAEELGCTVHWRSPGFLTLTDRFGVTWELGDYGELAPIGRRNGRVID